MFPRVLNPPVLELSAASAGWLESTSAAIAAIAICILAFLLWWAYAKHADKLAEMDRRLAEAKEASREVERERDTLARESHGKSEMLATLSREVRAHLNGIVGSADLMLDNSLSTTQREHLSTLRASAEALHQSLNDILDYASIESGKLRIERAPFDLREPLIEVVEHLSPLAVLKGIELVLIIAPDTPLLVTGDPARLRQSLLNLMANAVRFTSVGRVVLRAELPQGTGSTPGLAHSSTWLQFTVSDTGASIPEEMQASIFDRFALADSASPRKFGGSGLELAISRRLVELMGGRIGVRTTPDGGNEFWLILPLAADKSQDFPAVPLRKGQHAVILDDLAAARVALSALLTRHGIEHDSAETVAKATELLRDAAEAGVAAPVLLLDESIVREQAGAIEQLLAGEAAPRGVRIILMAAEPEAARAAITRFPVAAALRKPVVRADLVVKTLLAAPPATAAEPALAGPEPVPAPREAPYVLVVDDDEISRSVTSQLLERLGCDVERALSGLEAIERTRHARFDLIFMDCHMPELDGFATTGRIRALAGERAPPIVALTASTTAKDREKCFTSGMCDFVDKPARKAELDRILKRWTKPPRPPLG